MCALNSAVPCLWLSQVPAWAILTVELLSAHGAMAGCALKLRTVFHDTQRGFNDFSVHQLQCNLSCWQSVTPTVSYFSMPFCLGFYIFGTCVSTGVSGGGACDWHWHRTRHSSRRSKPLTGPGEPPRPVLPWYFKYFSEKYNANLFLFSQIRTDIY